MNYKVLEENILKNCAGLTKKKGEELFNNKSINNIQGKRIGDIYHIYCKLNHENKDFSTHIKYDLKKEKLCGFKCTCIKYKEYMEQGYPYYCEHIAATSFKFLNSLKNKIQDRKTEEKRKDTKIILSIESKLYYQKVNGINKFLLEFKVGNKVKYPINNIKTFLYGIFNNKELVIAENFKYSPSIHQFDKLDLEYLRFIKDNVKSEIVGNKLKISQKQLHFLLERVPREEIIFKDNYLEYKTKINKGFLDLAFNLREENGQFILGSEKNLPYPLDNEKRVFLFNREVYLLEKENSEKFSVLYNDLKKNSFKYFPGNNKSFIEIISTLSILTKKVNISDELRRFLRKYIKGRYFIYRENEYIYCDINVIYGDKAVKILKDDNLKLEWIRDFKYEERLIMTFERYGFIKSNGKMKFIGNDEKLFLFLNSKDNEISESGEIVIPGDLNEFYIYNAEDLYGTVYEEDWAIKLSYGIKGISEDDFKKAYKAFKNNNRFYKTKNKGFIDLMDDKLRNMFNMINLLNLENDLDKGISYISKSKISLVQELINKCELSFIYNKDSLKSIEEKLKELKEKDIELTTKLRSILRPYQEDGIKWIRDLYNLDFGGILADEMGLGKTLQTISFLACNKNKKFLIVVPTSLVFNWRDEFLKFTPELNIGIVHGDKRDCVVDNYESYNGLITTYGVLKKNLEKFLDKEFDICIIDEAQNIKNYKSQSSKAVKKIKAKFRLALTGTPIENNLKELWSIFDFIMPGFLYEIEEFDSKFNKDNEQSILLLKSLVNPFILRRTKEEVAKDLPGKSERTVVVKLEKNQEFYYKNYVQNIRDKIKTDSNIQVFSYLIRLRQICLHPALAFTEYLGGSGKFKVAHKIIDSALKENRKILVFSQFTTVLDMFGDELTKCDIKFYKLSGETLPKERIKLVNSFNKSKDVNIFLISLKAGGTGLNLTSANLVIHFDPWWNPAVESQATDRAHRIGQTKDVEVIKLVAKGTIEENIINLQNDKKGLIEDILSGTSINNSSINKEMIQELVKNYIEN